MSRLLLDTSVWVEVLRNPESPQAEHLASLTDDTDVVLSSIVAAELAEGFRVARRPERGRELFARLAAAFTPYSFDFDAADAYGDVRADLRARGASIGPMDELIAGQAMSLGAVVATLNLKDFEKVAGLRVADWRSSTLRRGLGATGRGLGDTASHS